jgi:hypothetical protein
MIRTSDIFNHLFSVSLLTKLSKREIGIIGLSVCVHHQLKRVQQLPGKVFNKGNETNRAACFNFSIWEETSPLSTIVI